MLIRAGIMVTNAVLLEARTSDGASMSIPVQEKLGRKWAADNGLPVAFVARDKATSGEVPPDQREHLGPWLTEPNKIDQWSVLVAVRFNRISRSVFDWSLLRRWADARGKDIKSITEPCDLATPEGSLMANNLIAMAELERIQAGQNRGAVKAVALDEGRPDGGRRFYPYDVIGVPGAYRRVRNDARVQVTLAMVDAALYDGKGFLTLARELNDQNIPTLLGGLWTDNAVANILRSPALMGCQTQGGHGHPTMRRDANGDPIRFTDDPLIPEWKFNALQQAIASRSRAREESQENRMLLQVAWCAECSLPGNDVPLYGFKRVSMRTRPKRDTYWCKRGCGVSVALAELEAYVTRLVLSVADGPGVKLWESMTDAQRNAWLLAWGARFTVDSAGHIDGRLMAITERPGQRLSTFSHELDIWSRRSVGG